MGSQTDQNGIGGDPSESEYFGLSSAMLTALFHKPHDRQFIIDLENSIISFIESNAESYELRPMNSYYRLLSHQIAEYHNLKHALARTPSSFVIIFKGAGFQRPSGKPLLQELEPVASTFDNLPDAQEVKSSRKYRILKRIDGQNGDSSSPLVGNETSSTEPSSDIDGSKTDLELQRVERERQYEQRKQEIFDAPLKEEVSLEKDEEGNSPQPSQFETSRYRFHHIDSSPPPQPRFNNRRKKGNHHNGNRRNFNDNKFNHKDYRATSGVPYSMNYMMYPSGSMQSGQGQHPLLPMLYPAPFPMDSNGYLPPFMYQTVANGMVDPKGAIPAGYMAFPPPFGYAQHVPNYQHLPPEVRNHNYSQNSSEKLSSDSPSASTSDIQSHNSRQKPDDSGVPAENAKIDSALDEATNGVKNLAV